MRSAERNLKPPTATVTWLLGLVLESCVAHSRLQQQRPSNKYGLQSVSKKVQTRHVSLLGPWSSAAKEWSGCWPA